MGLYERARLLQYESRPLWFVGPVVHVGPAIHLHLEPHVEPVLALVQRKISQGGFGRVEAILAAVYRWSSTSTRPRRAWSRPACTARPGLISAMASSRASRAFETEAAP